MNIKYRFKDSEKVSQPLTPVNLFKDNNGGLYPWNPSSTLKPAQIFQNNIDLINQRISQITKQLTYWDLYKLVAQVTSPTDLDSVFAGLIPGQACVINCNSFLDNNQTYHRGDVIVKMLDGEAAYIPAIASGYYFPDPEESGDDGSGNFRLVFKYSNEDPVDPIPIDAPQGSIENSYIYGIYKTIEDFINEGSSFDAIQYNGHDIKPIIKFYSIDNEEIDIHVKASLTNNKWEVTLDIPSIVEYIQVK